MSENLWTKFVKLRQKNLEIENELKTTIAEIGEDIMNTPVDFGRGNLAEVVCDYIIYGSNEKKLKKFITALDLTEKADANDAEEKSGKEEIASTSENKNDDNDVFDNEQEVQEKDNMDCSDKDIAGAIWDAIGADEDDENSNVDESDAPDINVDIDQIYNGESDGFMSIDETIEKMKSESKNENEEDDEDNGNFVPDIEIDEPLDYSDDEDAIPNESNPVKKPNDKYKDFNERTDTHGGKTNYFQKYKNNGGKQTLKKK